MDIEFENRIYEIDVNLIDNDENWNCRGQISSQECLSLARDIREHGQQQPGQLRVYDEPRNGKPYGLISGFRRFHAVAMINCSPTYRAVFKKNMTDFEAKAMNFAENRERKDLNILQQAKVFEYYLKAGCTEEQIMEICNVSRSYVQPRCMLLRMDKEIQLMAAAGYLTQTNIRDLNSYINPKDRLAAAKELQTKKSLGIKAIVAKPKVSKRPKDQIKMQRSPRMIKDLQVHLFDQKIPSGFHSRCLAWAGGIIPDVELYEDIEEHAMSIHNNQEFRDYIQSIDKEYSDPLEVGNTIIDLISNFEGPIYERPVNGFPQG